jgi:hypothetical protein
MDLSKTLKIFPRWILASILRLIGRHWRKFMYCTYYVLQTLSRTKYFLHRQCYAWHTQMLGLVHTGPKSHKVNSCNLNLWEQPLKVGTYHFTWVSNLKFQLWHGCLHGNTFRRWGLGRVASWVKQKARSNSQPKSQEYFQLHIQGLNNVYIMRKFISITIIKNPRLLKRFLNYESKFGLGRTTNWK